MKRGREKFKQYKFLILGLSNVFLIFPKSVRIFFFKVVRNLNGNVGLAIRYMLLKTIAKKIGDNVSIHPGVYILNPDKLIIGNNVSLHPMCYIDAWGEIIIGNNVSIAHGVSLLSSNHFYKSKETFINNQGMEKRKLEIKNDVWIGAKVTVLGGVTINTGTVIAAGAVVTKTFDDNVILGGIPSKVLRRR